jgi:molecular chaperone DnaK
MTIQYSEVIQFENKTYGTNSYPLESYLGNHNVKFKAPNTGCWRGYIGNWEVIDDKLFLIDFKGYLEDSAQVGIDYLFQGKQRVFADWYSGKIKIHLDEGELIDAFLMHYEYLVLEFNNGQLLSKELIDLKNDTKSEDSEININSKIMKKTIGIDLGTTNSAMAFKDTEVKILRVGANDELLPSCVSYIKNEIVVGRTALKTGLKRNPENTILSIKRLMGGAIKDKMVQDMIQNKKYYKFGITNLKGGTDDSVAVLLDGKQYTPEQISAEILKELKKEAEEKLGDEVTHAVVTVPAYFTEKQKNATRIAAQLAGLKVQKLLAEPTAAAIAYGVDKLKIGDSKTVLIYDFGGGTFDLSILNIVDGQYMEAGTGGDRWLGGDNIDQTLQNLLYKKVEEEYNIEDLNALVQKMQKAKRDALEAEIRSEAEKAKIQLSSSKTADIYIPNQLIDENGDIIDIEFEIERDEFEKAIRTMIDKTINLIDELLNELGYEISMIDNIILVGGSSCIPLVKQLLSKKYGSDKILLSEKPMLAVAEGAAILSHRLGDKYEAPLEISNSVDEISCSTNHNYFIEELAKEGGTKHRLIIEKQHPLPVIKSEVFKTTVNNQKFVKVSIYSDVEDGEKELQTTSYFTIDKELPIKSEIVFDIELDVNENFRIEAYPKGHKDLKKEVILPRGQKDDRAFKTIEEFTHKINSEVINWKVQDKFFAIQMEMIKLSEEIGKDNAISEKWSEIDFKVKNAYDEAKKEDKEETEGNRDENIIGGAIMLIKEYGAIMRQTDVKNLVNLLKDFEESEPIDRSDIISRVDEITDNYTDLFALFRLKEASDEAINRYGDGSVGETNAEEDSKNLQNMHDKILSCFKSGDKDRGYEILNESLPLAMKYL